MIEQYALARSMMMKTVDIPHAEKILGWKSWRNISVTKGSSGRLDNTDTMHFVWSL